MSIVSGKEIFSMLMKQKAIIAVVLGVGIAAVIVALYGPWRTTAPEDSIVAEVGDRVITLRDFTLNYEFGFPHLKQGNTLAERRRSYLDAMVNEMLLANEGYHLGMEKHQRVEAHDHEAMTDILADALINDEIVGKTTVSDGEVHDAINRSKVQFKVRYWGEPTRAGAVAACTAMRRHGYVKALDSILSAHNDIRVEPSMFESGYLNAFETEPALVGAVKDMQIGEISDPVSVNDGYFVFQLVDIRRAGIMEHEYASHYPTIKKVLLNVKYDEGIARFVGRFMTANNVVTRGGPFWALADAVAEWIEEKGFERMSLHDAVAEASQGQSRYLALKAMWEQPIVTYLHGRFTVGEFLQAFKPSLRDMNPSNMDGLRKLVNREVALTVRNQLLANEARHRGLDELPEVKHERLIWRDKSVYEEMRESYVGGLPLDKNTAREIKALLTHKADSLRAITRVVINYKAIDTLTIPESKASRWMGMQLYKLGNKKLAIPMTDGLWGAMH